MSDSDYDVTLAVLRSDLSALEKLLNQKIDLELRARDKDLVKAETELARRLEILNGEADRLRVMQASYVPREVHDAKHEEAMKELRAVQGVQNNMLGRMAVIGAIAGTLATMVGKWLIP